MLQSAANDGARRSTALILIGPNLPFTTVMLTKSKFF
jgi:hypothetical protein